MPLSNLETPVKRRKELDDEPAADVTTNTGPHLPKDRFGRRFAWGLLISIIVNVAIWTFVSGVVRSHYVVSVPPITFKRIILQPPPKPPKRLPEPPHPKVKQKIKPVVKQMPKPIPVKSVPPPPPAEHNHILIATGLFQATNTAIPGGNAPTGVPITHQNIGQGNQDVPPPVVTPPPVLTPPPPVVQPVQPVQPSPPAVTTQDAVPENQVQPQIPDDLTTDDYKSYVRAKVDIAADGSFTVTLLTSSGNEEVDQAAINALKKWTWKPALRDGQPIASTERFRYNFNVQ